MRMQQQTQYIAAGEAEAAVSAFLQHQAGRQAPHVDVECTKPMHSTVDTDVPILCFTQF